MVATTRLPRKSRQRGAWKTTALEYDPVNESISSSPDPCIARGEQSGKSYDLSPEEIMAFVYRETGQLTTDSPQVLMRRQKHHSNLPNHQQDLSSPVHDQHAERTRQLESYLIVFQEE